MSANQPENSETAGEAPRVDQAEQVLDRQEPTDLAQQAKDFVVSAISAALESFEKKGPLIKIVATSPSSPNALSLNSPQGIHLETSVTEVCAVTSNFQIFDDEDSSEQVEQLDEQALALSVQALVFDKLEKMSSFERSKVEFILQEWMQENKSFDSFHSFVKHLSMLSLVFSAHETRILQQWTTGNAGSNASVACCSAFYKIVQDYEEVDQALLEEKPGPGQMKRSTVSGLNVHPLPLHLAKLLPPGYEFSASGEETGNLAPFWMKESNSISSSCSKRRRSSIGLKPITPRVLKRRGKQSKIFAKQDLDVALRKKKQAPKKNSSYTKSATNLSVAAVPEACVNLDGASSVRGVIKPALPMRIETVLQGRQKLAQSIRPKPRSQRFEREQDSTSLGSRKAVPLDAREMRRVQKQLDKVLLDESTSIPSYIAAAVPQKQPRPADIKLREAFRSNGHLPTKKKRKEKRHRHVVVSQRVLGQSLAKSSLQQSSAFSSCPSHLGLCDDQGSSIYQDAKSYIQNESRSEMKRFQINLADKGVIASAADRDRKKTPYEQPVFGVPPPADSARLPRVAIKTNQKNRFVPLVEVE